MFILLDTYYCIIVIYYSNHLFHISVSLTSGSYSNNSHLRIQWHSMAFSRPFKHLFNSVKTVSCVVFNLCNLSPVYYVN